MGGLGGVSATEGMGWTAGGLSAATISEGN